ncbi:MAG: peptidoglycan DD-metalloendopeptidase family protein [Gammaproteobacteria bacterium]|nr:peptidoglycan DD-metalloendopeptidase family protein [Gammaproteobacteria bacterium]
MKKLFYLSLAASLYFHLATTLAFPLHQPVPGGTAIIELSSADTTQPTAFYKNQRVAVHKHDGAWYALIGISLNTKPGRYIVSYQFDDNKLYQHSFDIKNKTYKAQYLNVKNKRKVNPTAEDMKRIVKERAIKTAAKNTWSEQTIQTEFVRPVDGRISSIFGLRRFFNQQARRPHSGLDIAAAQGTPVKAIADGRVIETADFFFSGNMIYLDHGQGVISLYAHLYKTHVKPGQHVKQGEIIGEVGETGRVTGPHLHLSLLLNRTAVDPEHWLPATKPQ